MPEVRPHHFFSDTPPQQIIGSETEYNIQFPKNWDEDESLAIFLNHATLNQVSLIGAKRVYDFGPNYSGGRPNSTFTTDVFLSNGSRVYIDVGHLEYCTPESLGPRQAAATDAAGAIVMDRLRANSGSGQAVIYRRTGLAGNTERRSANLTNGHHENFLVPTDGSELIDQHMPTFLATRLWAWSGIVRSNFELSQKITGIGRANTVASLSGFTTEGKKPMMHLKAGEIDEDVNANPKWSRLEIRFAESTHMPHAKFLSYAATSLVLRLCAHHNLVPELGRYNVDHAIADVVASNISQDLTLREVQRTHGGYVTALDVQDHYVEMFEKINEVIELPDDERMAIPLLRALIDDMRQVQKGNEDLKLIANRVEWAARYRYISRKLGEEAITITNPEAEALDLLWDRNSSGYGPRYAKRTRMTDAIAKIGPSQEMIDHHVYNSPSSTRANLRAQLIENDDLLFDTISWSGAQYNMFGEDSGTKKASWPNPYKGR